MIQAVTVPMLALHAISQLTIAGADMYTGNQFTIKHNAV
jgi:hypothetical protein